MQVKIPRDGFCRLNRGGRAVVSFVAPSGATAAGEPPVTIDPVGADDATMLFDEACPHSATASR
jgi:hypothetical protein